MEHDPKIYLIIEFYSILNEYQGKSPIGDFDL